MNDDAHPTLGEAHRRLDRVETRLDNRVVSLNTYRAEYNALLDLLRLTRQELEREIADQRTDLAAMKDRVTWAWRAAITCGVFPFVVGFGLLVFQVRGGP